MKETLVERKNASPRTPPSLAARPLLGFRYIYVETMETHV